MQLTALVFVAKENPRRDRVFIWCLTPRPTLNPNPNARRGHEICTRLSSMRRALEGARSGHDTRWSVGGEVGQRSSWCEIWAITIQDGVWDRENRGVQGRCMSIATLGRVGPNPKPNHKG